MLSEYGENREFIGEEGENDIICPPEIAALAGALLQPHQPSYLSDPWGEKSTRSYRVCFSSLYGEVHSRWATTGHRNACSRSSLNDKIVAPGTGSAVRSSILLLVPLEIVSVAKS